MEYKFNKYQSLFNPEDEKDGDYIEFMEEVLSGIPFIQNLINPDRKYAKDLERKDFKYAKVDDAGNPTGEFRVENKIDPNLTNPHILEDMDYFRPAALHFEKHGCYTRLTPNRHPQSEYTKFWREEKRRCLEGYVRESDGEWIPGYYYFYLNYSRIELAVETQDSGESDNVRGNRVTGFPGVWDGDYLYFHYVEKAESLGLFGTTLKTRGRGYSYKGGSKPARNFTLIKKSNNFLLAFDDAYLTGDGIWSKAIDNLDWLAKHTSWPRLRLRNSNTDLEIKGGYKRKGSDALYGNRTLLSGIVTRNNEDKARGIRGKYAAFEEAGKYPKLLDVWQIAKPSYKQGNVVYGYMEAFGTGGSDEADFQALENLFRSPNSYNILGLPNVYDLNVSTEDKVAFFMPEYLNRAGCFDDNGNSDVMKALVLIYRDRKKARANANDPFAIVREKAEAPITPTEAMMRKSGTIFPIHLLTEFLTDVRVNESKFVSQNYIVDLELEGGKVIWKYNKDKKPIRKYPHDPGMKHGAVEIFDLPEEDTFGQINPERYIIGIDPYVADGEANSSSLGCVLVFDLFTDNYVAEYTGRPTFASDFFEICRRLCIMYNAQAGYENRDKGIFGHFRNKNSIHYLAPVPEYLMQKNIVKSTGMGNTALGIPPNTAVIAEGLRLQAEWTEEDSPNPIIKEVEGVMTPVYQKNYQKIKSVGYLEELVKWNPEQNFDRVSAANCVMIMRADRQLRLESAKSTRVKRKSNDPFFRKIFRQSGDYSFKAIGG